MASMPTVAPKSRPEAAPAQRKRGGRGRAGPPVVREGGTTEAGPQRTCVVTRVEYPQAALLRCVVDPEGRVVGDAAGKLPGRGLYVHPTRANLLALLKRRGVWEKLAGRPVQLPEGSAWLALVEQLLARRLLDGLGLAKRAGALAVGLREVEEGMAKVSPPLVIVAGDTAHHTHEKITRALTHHPATQVLELMDRERLGQAVGGAQVAVLAVTAAAMAKRVAADGGRWLALTVGSDVQDRGGPGQRASDGVRE